MHNDLRRDIAAYLGGRRDHRGIDLLRRAFAALGGPVGPIDPAGCIYGSGPEDFGRRISAASHAASVGELDTHYIPNDDKDPV